MMGGSLTQPNVLLVTVDHWPGALMGSRGSTIMTPTLDALAREGTRFDRAYSECPVCIPARRTLMTGLTPRGHGDRIFNERQRMPPVPTLANTFRQAGYQAFAVGKLHVYPPRDRIGFDDVTLVEEGRLQFGAIDDYELALGDAGYAGQLFAHGMSSNEYSFRPWHLPEQLHVTNWTTQQAVRQIKRRDPTRPGFWYVSYIRPHPPLEPPQAYLDLYRDIAPDPPVMGEWAGPAADPPAAVAINQLRHKDLRERDQVMARRAFMALCTQIDHQLRLIIGTLRQEGLLDNTIMLFTADHGDMLGDHGMWAKRSYYEKSAQVPMLLLGAAGDERVERGRVDDRLVGLQDVMPTLLDLAGIPVPQTVEGQSMVGPDRRELLFGEINDGSDAVRMMHDGRHKLIYYPGGNRVQLFDLATDPRELNDRSNDPDYAAVRERLTTALIAALHSGDEAWVEDGALVGLPRPEVVVKPNRGLTGQRGLHWPPPPVDDAMLSGL